MNLSEHFTLEEFTKTSHKVDNAPSEAIIENLKLIASTMEQVRAILGKPILVSSGYRSEALNEIVGGSKKSAHMQGLACDFTCPQFGNCLDICHRLQRSELDFDQMIYEKTWVHIGLSRPGIRNRREVLTLLSPNVYFHGIIEKV